MCPSIDLDECAMALCYFGVSHGNITCQFYVTGMLPCEGLSVNSKFELVCDWCTAMTIFN